MSLEAWLLFCVTETVRCGTPGPAVFAVDVVACCRARRVMQRPGSASALNRAGLATMRQP